MTFYADMQALAQSLLGKFDQGGLVISVATAGGTPYAPTTTYVDTPVTGVVSGINPKFITGTLIQATDLQVTIPGGVVAPKATDLVKINGVQYGIVQIVPKPADGTVAAYTIFVRK